MTPPRLARWLLERLLPVHDRGAIVGDLDEEFRARRRAGRAASGWYWRQAIAALPYALGRRAPRLSWFAADARFTLRLWRRYPSFTLAAIGTQAVGIAIATAVLAAAYAILLRPLPYREPDRLVHLFEGRGRFGQLSYQDFVDLRAATRALDAVAGYNGGSRTLSIPGAAPERVPIVSVSDGFFEVLGVQPMAGRTFTGAEVQSGGPPVAILSHQLWTRRFGSDPAIVGSTITVNGLPTQVIGVLPAPFVFPLRGRPDLWLPLQPTAAQIERGFQHWIDGIARLRADVTAAQVQQDLDAVARLYAARDQRNHGEATLRTIPLRDMMISGVKPTMRALLAGVGLVLVVMCATSATLLLSQSVPRRRELAVRLALGASGRVILQLMIENLMLSLAGGMLGLGAGHALLRGFASGMPLQQRLTLPFFDDPGVTLWVGAGVLFLSVVTGVFFGAGPAMLASRAGGTATLKTGAPTAGARDLRLRAALVAVQVAVALILLASAALLATSLYKLLQIPGVADPQEVVTFRLNLPPKYRTPESIHLFRDRLLEGLTASPGVTASAFIDNPPLTGAGNNGTPQVAGRPIDPRTPPVLLRSVSEGYFAAMRVPVLRGRVFRATDTAAAPPVVVVNRSLAASMFAGEEAIGQRISFQFAPGPFEIVGIVDDERFDDIDRPLLPVLYFSLRQGTSGSFAVLLRAADTGAAMAAARDVVNRLDAEVPVFAVRTVEQITKESPAMFLRRTALSMLGMFAVASVVLAAMGLYGVLAQAVADRTREIGVRLALGATRAAIVRTVLRGALGAVVLGVTLGAAGTLVASRWLAALAYSVSATDPLLIAAAAAFLALVALIACLVPVRRAVSVNPATAVRES